MSQAFNQCFSPRCIAEVGVEGLQVGSELEGKWGVEDEEGVEALNCVEAQAFRVAVIIVSH